MDLAGPWPMMHPLITFEVFLSLLPNMQFSKQGFTLLLILKVKLYP